MIALIQTIGYVLCGLAACGGVYGLVALGLVARFMGRGRPEAADSPAVTLIKPLHGAAPGLYEALESFLGQDYAAPVQIVFGLQDAADPAAEVVAALRRRHPDRDIGLVIDSRLYGSNRKVSNLINIAARARHDVLVISDADIRVGRRYLTDVVAALQRPKVGAVSCAYVGEGRGDLWSTLSAMAITYQFLPNVVLGRAVGLARPCFGSTIALTRGVLNRIGGLEAVVDHLADDYEIGRAVRALGLEVSMPPVIVSHQCTETDAPELVSHELRWNRTVRQIDPAGHAGSFITHPLALALIGAPLSGFAPAAVAVLLAIVVTRIATKFALDALTGARSGAWWLLPARDVLCFGVFVASFAVNTVGWQGHRFRVGRDGVLIHP